MYEDMPNDSLTVGSQADAVTFEESDACWRLNIATHVAYAANHFHGHYFLPIFYSKPSNVLLDNGMIAYIGDFRLRGSFQVTVMEVAKSYEGQQDPSGILLQVSMPLPKCFFLHFEEKMMFYWFSFL